MDGLGGGGVRNVCLHPLSLSHMQLSPPGSISPNYHTWMLNRREQASVGYESVSHLQGGYMRVHANRPLTLAFDILGATAVRCQDAAAVPRDTDPHSPGIFNSPARSLISRGNKARILNGTPPEW